jgi:tetratricopeptide (TPR) repeat protein
MNCTKTKLVELIQGALSPEESKDVLDHLTTCTSCRERAKVMAVLGKIYPESAIRQTGKRIYLLAAGVLLLALIPAIVKLADESESEPNGWVHITESRPYPYFPVYPRSEQHGITKRRNAFQAYIRGEYQLALKAFEELEADPEILFFRGICEYFLGKRNAALTHLLAASRNERWRLPALWYQANIYLGIGETEKASLILEELRESGEEYAFEATSLLNHLKESLSRRGQEQ